MLGIVQFAAAALWRRLGAEEEVDEGSFILPSVLTMSIRSIIFVPVHLNLRCLLVGPSL